MYYKLAQTIMYRNYNSFGYITDNRNFGYVLKNNSRIIGDRIVSQSGSVFLSVLTKEPQKISKILEKIMEYFPDIGNDIILKDVLEFYSILEKEGFVVSGVTKYKCNWNDSHHSVEVKNDDTKKGIDQRNVETEKYFIEQFNGAPQLRSLHIEITSRCNERCIHCYVPKNNSNSLIEPKLFYSIVNQSRDMKILHLNISGGEPMLHRSFVDFLEMCHEYDFSVNILSNLTLLNNRILNEMKKNHLLCVQTSLYSMDHNIHDGITKKVGSFKKTKRSILRLLDYGIPIQINCPIMKQNKECFSEVVKWAIKMNINISDDFSLFAIADHSKKNISCRLKTEEISDVLIKKNILNSQYCQSLFQEAENKKSQKPDDPICSVCRSSICINENGDVFPCVGWLNNVIGNINNTLLKDIWEKSNAISRLRELSRKDLIFCNNCDSREYCDPCMMINSNEDSFGNPLMKSTYFCSIAKLKKQFVHDKLCK
jgi:radical SAM protein with 4Fe4S-binding SPASM domain